MQKILWGVNLPTLLLMMADAPKYKPMPKEDDKPKGKPKDDQPQVASSGSDIANFFQTHLNKQQ